MVAKAIPVLIVILFALIASSSLLVSGLHPTHDGEYHVVRFYEFYKTLEGGDWYPRWAPDLNSGFGVPLFNYVYPLPNYIASLFHFLGISFIDSFKLNMFFATILGALFFFLWSRQLFGNLGGAVSAVLYTFSPYHFVDVYVRGSVGEVWALALFPAFLWLVTYFHQKRKTWLLLLCSLLLALIIFSHNILALMFFLFSFTYLGLLVFLSKDKIKVSLQFCLIILLGLGLSAVFWLPALMERHFAVGLEVYDFRNHFPELYQLLFPSWGSGFSSSNLQNQMSFQIGVANLLAVLTTFFVFLLRKIRRKNEPQRYLIIFFLVWFIALFFLMLRISTPIWEKLPFMNYFQFPWRLLSLETLVASLLGGYIFKVWPNKTIALVVLLVTFLLGVNYIRPAYYHQRDDTYYLTRPNFIDGTNSPGNAFNTTWFNPTLKRQKEKTSLIEGKGKIKVNSIKSTEYLLHADIDTPVNMLIHTAYFPGWKAYINGKESQVERTRDGLFSLKIPKGVHEVKIKLEDTSIRRLATVITFLSLLLGLIHLFATSDLPWVKRKRKKKDIELRFNTLNIFFKRIATSWTKLRITSKLLLISYLGVLMFLLFLYRIYMKRISAFGCFDDCLNIVAGYFIAEGKILYSEVFFNHQMLMAYLSFVIQNLFDPINIFSLVLAHRQFLFLVGVVFSTVFIFRFRWAGLASVLFFESTKFYLFGDRFLAEGLIVYPLAYLIGLLWYKYTDRPIYRLEYVLSGLLVFTIVFSREPFIPVALLIYLLLLLGGKKTFPGITQAKLFSIVIFILLTTTVFLITPLQEYSFNVFTLNRIAFAQELTKALSMQNLLKIFAYPLYILVEKPISFFGIILIGLSVIFITAVSIFIVRFKKFKQVLMILFILGLSNIRFVTPGTMFYEAFHAVPWYGMYIIITFLLLRDAFNGKKYWMGKVLLIIFILVLLAYSFSPRSFIWEKSSPHAEFITHYGNYLSYGEAIAILATSQQDTLFVDGFDELINWQAKLPSSYKYSMYTSLMPRFAIYANERNNMFLNNPPDFYYGSCPKEKNKERLLPEANKQEYIRLLVHGRPSCLYIKKTKLEKISFDQWRRVEHFGFSRP